MNAQVIIASFIRGGADRDTTFSVYLAMEILLKLLGRGFFNFLQFWEVYDLLGSYFSV